jgi:CDP-diacylglycerol--glycerol-3-phosphate 3-phosphatidyltransferase
MLNFLRPFFVRLFRPLIQGLARTPVTPNMITVIGTLGVCAAALALFPIGETFPGAFIATLFVFTDMLDGQLARIKGDSGKYGAWLDSTMDRFADACVFGGITIWFIRTNHLLAVVGLFCLACGLCVSYVKARAEGLGLNADVGLIERPERLLIGLTGIGLSGLGVPWTMNIGMWAVAAGSAYTLWQRMRAVYVDAKSQTAAAAAAAAGTTAAESAAAGAEEPVPGQPVPGQPAPGQPAPGQPAPGQQPVPGEGPALGTPVAEPGPAPAPVRPAPPGPEEA